MKSRTRTRPPYQPGITTHVASSLSLLPALITAGILGFFVDSLRRDAMPVPWPILLIMSTSCITIAGLVTAFLVRCWFPTSLLLQLLLHVPISILWICTVASLGDQLSEHLTRICPSHDTFGHNMAIVCQLFKALFAFAVISSACTVFLSVSDVLAWSRIRKGIGYTAMEKNIGAVSSTTPFKNKPNRNMGRMNEKSKLKGRLIEEDELSIMMMPMQSEGIEKSRLGGSGE